MTPPRASTPQVVAPPPSVRSGDVAPKDEPSLMAELRSLKGSNPERAAQLASDGNARFPDSSDAPERASILIHSLVQEGRLTEARRSAEEMVNHYPDSAWVRDVELFTGAHRHRNIRINDAGGFEYY
jgi:hypothetical protein